MISLSPIGAFAACLDDRMKTDVPAPTATNRKLRSKETREEP